MSTINLQLHDRFGNQCLQYLYARGYANRNGAVLHTSPWIGQTIFEIEDPPIETELPQRYDMDRATWDGQTDIELTGWGLHQMTITYTRTEAKSWLRFRPEVARLLDQVWIPRLASHIRHNDFLTMDRYIAISEHSYIKAWQEFEPEYEDMQTISENDPTLIAELTDMGAGFLPDFVTLMRAHVLIRANSTFSYMAAILGDNYKVYAPNLNGIEPVAGVLQDVPFVLGNWPAISCVHDNCSDLYLPE